jgi:hypothetical protein
VDHLLVDQRATVFGMKAASFRLGAVLLPVLLLILPLARLHAEEVLLTFGDMLRLRELPVESAKRALTPEELVLYQDYESYAYTPFEALQVANNTAELLNGLEEGCTRSPRPKRSERANRRQVLAVWGRSRRQACATAAPPGRSPTTTPSPGIERIVRQ